MSRRGLLRSLGRCCLGLVALLVAGGAAEVLPSSLPQYPPATPKNPPPYISLLFLRFCSAGSNQHKIWAAGGKSIFIWEAGWEEPFGNSFTFSCFRNLEILHGHPFVAAYITQTHWFTSSGKYCMIRLSVQHSPTLTHSNQMQSPLLLPNSVTNSGPCQMWLLRKRNKFLNIGRRRYTDKHIKRFSHMTHDTWQVLPPALCAEDQIVLHECFLCATTILWSECTYTEQGASKAFPETKSHFMLYSLELGAQSTISSTYLFY